MTKTCTMPLIFSILMFGFMAVGTANAGTMSSFVGGERWRQ